MGERVSPFRKTVRSASRRRRRPRPRAPAAERPCATADQLDLRFVLGGSRSRTLRRRPPDCGPRRHGQNRMDPLVESQHKVRILAAGRVFRRTVFVLQRARIADAQILMRLLTSGVNENIEAVVIFVWYMFQFSPAPGTC